jgi:hypothetical protein
MNLYPDIHRGTIRGIVFFLCLAVIVLSLHGCATQKTDASPAISPDEMRYRQLEEKWGIRPESLRLSAAGHMLDFRYRVTDPKKAIKIMKDPNPTTYLLDQASKVKLAVPSTPKIGSLRQTDMDPKAGRIYFSLFSNPGGLVKAGNKVTVVIGEFRAENLVVN